MCAPTRGRGEGWGFWWWYRLSFSAPWNSWITWESADSKVSSKAERYSRALFVVDLLIAVVLPHYRRIAGQLQTTLRNILNFGRKCHSAGLLPRSSLYTYTYGKSGQVLTAKAYFSESLNSPDDSPRKTTPTARTRTHNESSESGSLLRRELDLTARDHTHSWSCTIQLVLTSLHSRQGMGQVAGGSVHYLQGLVAKYLGVSLYFATKNLHNPDSFPGNCQGTTNACYSSTRRRFNSNRCPGTADPLPRPVTPLSTPLRPFRLNATVAEDLTRKERFSPVFPAFIKVNTSA
jgi:hypothetical protein